MYIIDKFNCKLSWEGWGAYPILEVTFQSLSRSPVLLACLRCHCNICVFGRFFLLSIYCIPETEGLLKTREMLYP